MADEEATEIDGEEGEEKGGGKLKLIIMIVVGVVLIAVLSIVGTWFMLKDSGDDAATDAESMAGEGMEVIEGTGEAIYHALQPAFIVNFNANGKSRFLQLELSVLTRDPASIEVMVLHNPLIRNNLLDVLSEQDILLLGSADGKEKLAKELTKAIQKILEDEMGREGVESILYRSFIMQ